tara:strand:- start:12254 stop:13378 length:1125 start_codon:yes stop_codon:yes gene_type:complete
MVLMALDHVRGYFFFGSFTSNLTDLSTTTPIFFFTRVITHFCAPVFVLLTGVSAYLYGYKKNKYELSKFLFIRGIWLIFLEIIVNNFLWFFDPSFSMILLQVIWAIGFGMLFLSGLVYLSNRTILMLGLSIVFFHNLLDFFVLEGKSVGSILWYFLHQMAVVEVSDSTSIIFGYPVLPWIGLMAVGYVLGSVFINYQPKERCSLLIKYGFYSVILFLIVRFLDIYGDPNPFSMQKSFSSTIMDFFNTTKYPPSLLFILMTIGPSLLVLAYVEKIKNKITDFFIVFGRVPLFYYFLHILVIHILAIIILIFNGGDFTIMLNMTPYLGDQQQLVEYGYPMWVVYLIWFVVILILYPLCYKYMKYKSSSNKWWLSYL